MRARHRLSKFLLRSGQQGKALIDLFRSICVFGKLLRNGLSVEVLVTSFMASNCTRWRLFGNLP